MPRPDHGSSSRPSGDASIDHFAVGVGHFNALEFWEAHESWETLWLVADGALVDYYQGLIQLAAAYHHMKRGTFRGAERLFESALRRLEGYPEGLLGLERGAAIAAAQSHRKSAAASQRIVPEDYPKLAYLPR